MHRRRFVLYAPVLGLASLVAYEQTAILGRVSKPEGDDVRDHPSRVVGTENIQGSTQLANSSKVNAIFSHDPKTSHYNDPSRNSGNPSDDNAGLSLSDIIGTITKSKDTITNLAIDTIQEDQRHPPKWAKEKATKDQPYVAETLYHHGQFPLSKLVLGGPAKPYFPNGAAVDHNNDETQLIWPARNESEAVCTVRKNTPKKELTMPREIPHNLQQLLKCFSWWQRNPHQRPVLHSELKLGDDKTRYLGDFYKGLQDVFGVRLDWVERKGNAPSVTVPIDWANMPSLLDAYVMDSQDAKTLANGFLNHYAANNKRRAGCPKEHTQQSKPRIAFLNREGSRRAIENHQEIIVALGTAGLEVRYQPNFDGMSMVDQITFLSEVDILMGPHGAQFTNTLFQPECGSLFEFFNENYYTPNFFGSLAALSGKHHFFVYNGGSTGTKPFFEARFTPLFSVRSEIVVQVTHRMVERWHSCCQHGFRGTTIR